MKKIIFWKNLIVITGLCVIILSNASVLQANASVTPEAYEEVVEVIEIEEAEVPLSAALETNSYGMVEGIVLVLALATGITLVGTVIARRRHQGEIEGILE
ncbi:MAG: hypothetical protein R3Y40_06660 [Eubacteriales bacterium]